MSQTNAQVAHLWANQSKPHATSRGMRFNGDTLYSYSQPIARLTRDSSGKPLAALITSDPWSNTTSHHCTLARQSLHAGVLVIRVVHVAPSYDETNLRCYATKIAEISDKARRSWRYAISMWHQVQSLVDQGNTYRELFLPTFTAFSMPLGWDDDLAKSEARRVSYENPDPASLDKRERERAKRLERKRAAEAERQRQFALTQAERVSEWQRGVLIHLPLAYALPTMVRVQPGYPDALETSHGARVPLKDAIKIFRMAQQCREAEKPLDTALLGLCQRRVGDFRLDAIDGDGTIHAGCHVIPWDETARLAGELGLLPGEPATTEKETV